MPYRTKNTDKANQEIGTKRPTETSADHPVITVDYERYAALLEGADLSEDQKRELLQTIWNIIVEFVSLGFSVHPLHHMEIACGQLVDGAPSAPFAEANGVQYPHRLLSDKFGTTAESEPGLIEPGGP